MDLLTTYAAHYLEETACEHGITLERFALAQKHAYYVVTLPETWEQVAELFIKWESEYHKLENEEQIRRVADLLIMAVLNK